MRTSETPEYRVWRSMRTRCENPRHHDYPYYGGRGITVCDRWWTFGNFIADMGLRPTPKHSIERVNNAGGYEPSNCRWVTRGEQSKNQRRRRDNQSGYVGVSPLRGKWQANIGCNGRLIYIGLFANLSDAVSARAEKARELGFNPDHGASR